MLLHCSEFYLHLGIFFQTISSSETFGILDDGVFKIY